MNLNEVYFLKLLFNPKNQSVFLQIDKNKIKKFGEY